MRFILEVGPEPFHLLNKYGGAIFFLVISSLALAPLATLYVALAVTHSLMTSGCGCDDGSERMSRVLMALQVCSQATLYYSMFFPFLLGLFSTHMSYRMMEEHNYRSCGRSPRISDDELRSHLQQNAMLLNEEDLCCQRSNKDSQTEKLCKIPTDCSICLKQYESGEQVAWSGNAHCRHAFHLECIFIWMSSWEQAQNLLCPCCRQPFLGEDLIKPSTRNDTEVARATTAS